MKEDLQNIDKLGRASVTKNEEMITKDLTDKLTENELELLSLLKQKALAFDILYQHCCAGYSRHLCNPDGTFKGGWYEFGEGF